jgi:hypothetical protein
MEMGVQHFPGCHQGDDQPSDKPAGYVPQDTEQCWHCGTATDRGCYCLMCAARAAKFLPGDVYHCPRCDRWWNYVGPVSVAAITFPWNV